MCVMWWERGAYGRENFLELLSFVSYIFLLTSIENFIWEERRKNERMKWRFFSVFPILFLYIYNRLESFKTAHREWMREHMKELSWAKNNDKSNFFFVYIFFQFFAPSLASCSSMCVVCRKKVRNNKWIQYIKIPTHYTHIFSQRDIRDCWSQNSQYFLPALIYFSSSFSLKMSFLCIFWLIFLEDWWVSLLSSSSYIWCFTSFSTFFSFSFLKFFFFCFLLLLSQLQYLNHQNETFVKCQKEMKKKQKSKFEKFHVFFFRWDLHAKN